MVRSFRNVQECLTASLLCLYWSVLELYLCVFFSITASELGGRCSIECILMWYKLSDVSKISLLIVQTLADSIEKVEN